MHDQNMAALRTQLVAALAAVDNMLARTVPDEISTTMGHAIAGFLRQKKVEVTPAHFDNIKTTMARFLSHVAGCRADEGVRVCEVTSAHVMAYRTVLVPQLAVKTVNHHMATLSCFFKWCVRLDYCTTNPAEGMKLRIKGSAAQERSAFSRDEIKGIFGDGFFRATAARCAWRWIPLIMLFSGARPEEVAQLRCKDVRYEGEVLVFDLDSMAEGQRRKTEASRRLVPVHSQLVEWGLAAKAMDGAGDDLLFPQLSLGARDRLAEAPGRWFNRTWLRSRCGFTDKSKVLYSLRHSVVTQWKVEHRVEEALIAQLVGHANSSMTTGRYGKAYDLAILQGVVELLDWPVLST